MLSFSSCPSLLRFTCSVSQHCGEPPSPAAPSGCGHQSCFRHQPSKGTCWPGACACQGSRVAAGKGGGMLALCSHPILSGCLAASSLSQKGLRAVVTCEPHVTYLWFIPLPTESLLKVPGRKCLLSSLFSTPRLF